MKRWIPLLLVLLLALGQLAVPAAAEPEPVNISFRTMDTTAGVNGDANKTTDARRTEGAASVKWQYAAASGKVPWYYVYCDNFNASDGVDITGATHMIFDLYVSNIAYLSFTAGDAGINLSDNSGGWNNNGGRVWKDEWLSVLQSLKSGWNHVVLPIDFTEATGSKVWAFRAYNTGGNAPAGFYTMLDDVRFVNEAYLNSEDYADTLAAKDVIAAISEVTADTSAEAVQQVRARYEALTPAQKEKVTNAADLDRIENLPAVNLLWHACEDGNSWDTEKSHGSLSLWNQSAVGDNCVRINCTDEMFFFSICPFGPQDFTYVTTVDFWFYTNDENIFQHGDCGFQLSYTNAWHSGGVGIPRTVLRALTLQKGWNHLVLPLDFSAMTADCDLTKIQRFRFFSVGLEADKQYELAMDEIRFANRKGIENAEYVIAGQVVDAINAIGTVNTYSGPSIEAARTAYDALTDARKALVTNYAVLQAAEAAFESLQDQTTVTLPDDMKQKPALPAESKVWTLSHCDEESPVSADGCVLKNVVSVEGESFIAMQAQAVSNPIQLIVKDSLMLDPVAVEGYAAEDLALKMQLYISNTKALKLSDGQIEITSSGRADDQELHWMLADVPLQNGWNNVYLELRNAVPDKGELDLSNILFFRLYGFLNQDVVLAVDEIRLTPRTMPEFNEDFADQAALTKWQSAADLTWDRQALSFTGSEPVQVQTAAYALNILQPDRTPIEFTLTAADPAALASVTVTLTDSAGKSAAQTLTPGFDADGKAYCMAVPADMQADAGFSFETAGTVTFTFDLRAQTTLWLDDITTKVRAEKYWRDWVYDYTAQPGDYSFAVIPDIQELTVNHPDMLTTIMQWIVDHKQSENIRYAIDVGDVTWNGHAGSTREFGTAARAFKKLQDAGIEYSIAYGNHDVQSGRDTTLLNRYFPLSNYQTFASYGGVKEEGKVDNIFFRFSVYGVPYLVLSLEFDPAADTLAWANRVVADHPDDNVIICVHGYMSMVYGERLTIGNTIWEKLASQHDNIFMVVCGHECVAADPGSLNWRVDKGVKGNTVYQVMANAQDIDEERDGVGLLLMLRFTNGGRTVNFHYFSPCHNDLAFKRVNQFSVTLPEGQLKADPTAYAPGMVADAIDALTGDDPAAVAAARAAYEALTDEQKAMVPNLAKLEALENKPAPSVAYGDVNGDGAVDAKDALLVLKAAVGKATLTADQHVCADVNGDDAIDAKDALLILKKAVNKLDRFPVEQ